MSLFDAWLGRVVADAYRIQSVLGRGGMGVVFAAEQLADGRKVALKMLLGSDPRDEARFQTEAAALTRLEHPNIVSMVDFRPSTANEPAFLVMSYLEGETLARLLRREGRLPAARAVSIALEILEGVMAAHAAGIIHRDLKPSNIFLVQAASSGVDGSREAPSHAESLGLHACIVDFGIAKLQGQSLTSSGAIVGTPSYMPPEQLLGVEGGVDVQSDVYAVGVILFEMLTGRHPFVGVEGMPAPLAVINTNPPAVHTICPDVSSELSEIVASAMAKSKLRRIPSAAQMRNMLMGLMATMTSMEGLGLPRPAPHDGTTQSLGAYKPPADVTPRTEPTTSHALRFGLSLAITVLVVGGLGAAAFVVRRPTAARTAPSSPPTIETAPSAAPEDLTSTTLLPDASAPAIPSTTSTSSPSPPPSRVGSCLCLPTHGKNRSSLCRTEDVSTPLCRCGEVGPNLSWVACDEPSVPCQWSRKEMPKTAQSGKPCRGFLIERKSDTEARASKAVDATMDCHFCKNPKRFAGAQGAPCHGRDMLTGEPVDGVIDCRGPWENSPEGSGTRRGFPRK